VIYLPIAMDIAAERVREAERRSLAAVAGRVEFGGAPGAPRRPSRARALLAGSVRALGDATHTASEAFCAAASRIEGAH
jgi:hypothetical protein